MSDEEDAKAVKYLFAGGRACTRMMKRGHTGAQYFTLAAAAILIWGFFITTHHVEATCIPSTGCEHALAYYNVQSTDTIDFLNLHFQTTFSTLQSYNKNLSTNITAGQKLLIPFQCMYCSNGQLQHLFQYSVVTGDTLANVVDTTYESLTTVAAISSATSGLENSNTIYPNQVLTIPVNCSCGDASVSLDYGLFTTYVVQSGDQLSSLATNFSVSSDYISKYNSNVQVLQPKQIIYIPTRNESGLFPAYNGTTTGTSPSSSKSSNVGVIVGAVVGGLVLGGLVLLGLFYGRKYVRKRSSKPKSEKDQHSGSNCTVLLPTSTSSAISRRDESGGSVSNMLAEFKSVEFSYEELSAATDNFSLSYKIGQGGFASVYLGVIHGQKLAIKKMTLQATKEFMAELKVLTNVHHTNLVQLIGYCTTNSLFLVYEFVENGTLDQHLHSRHTDDYPPLTWQQRVQISLDAARGLEYIHEHTKPTYIHRDIKSANILIDNTFRAKVADFGLAKLTDSATGTGVVGTFGYMSPEYALYGEVSPKLDVYAFGVVLFEIISGRLAIAVESNSSENRTPREGRTICSLFEPILKDPDGKAQLHKYIDPALNNEYPLDAVWKVATLAGRCTQAAPDLRPSIRVAVVQLMTLASSTQEWDVESLNENPPTSIQVH